LGRSNWEQTYPNYYSECTVNKKSNTITGYFNFKWKYKLESECYVENKDYPNGKTDFIKADGEIVLNNIRFIDDCIIWEGNNYVRDDTLCKRNENYYVKENQFSIGNINTYDKIEIIIKSENCFTKRITYHMILPQSIYKCSHEYFYSREIVKEDSTSSNDAQIVVGLHSVNSNVSSDLNNEFIDERDGKRYKTIKIGNQEWMAENLNYSTGNSWCYDNSSGNCNKYGRLYDWETAKNVCPSGWHLPSKSEFESLLSYYGEEERIIYTCLMLNSNLGFNVLFAGFYDFDGISKYAYHGIGDYNIYWTSTPYNENKMWFLYISRNDENARMNGEFGNLNLGFSVRCIHD